MAIQIDFSNTFVQSSIDDDIYIRVPPMFEPDKKEGDQEVILKLNQSLYGLVQAPYLWFNHCSDALGKIGLEPSQLDPCLFYGRGAVTVLYVDNHILLQHQRLGDWQFR
jgi:Reverse transcriptase (RNA-dependent DNA polymerase)